MAANYTSESPSLLSAQGDVIGASLPHLHAHPLVHRGQEKLSGFKMGKKKIMGCISQGSSEKHNWYP